MTAATKVEVYDGRRRLGTVQMVDAKGGAVAILPNGQQLGPFPDMATARSAVLDAGRRT